MKKIMWISLFFLIAFLTACSVEPADADYNSDSGSNSKYDSDGSSSDDDWSEYSGKSDYGNSVKKWSWTTNACEAFGGSTTYTGGCYLPCSSDDDCPEDSECWSGVWSLKYCKKTGYTYGETSSCMTGYGDYASGYDQMCNLSCDLAYGDTQCPSGFRCTEATGVELYGLAHDGFCTGASASSGGGGGSGVCSGCGGLFCSGKCVGCPGC